MITFFKTIIYIPLYNALIAILNINWIDAGLAAVILTVLVKIILYPLAKKAMVTQILMKEKESELFSIKEKYKDKQEQALKIMEFYKTNNINPFSSIFIIIIQIPVVFSLYYIFYKSGLPVVDTSMLYSFVKIPEAISMQFLGIIDVSQKSVFLAILAAVSSFLQMQLASKSTQNKPVSGVVKEDFSQIMAKQMKYTMPFMVFFISWKISAIIALYWFVSNITSLIQEACIRRKIKKTSLS
ncbi:MAG: membrane protein insertase YidC [Parcubacteria group bacterium]|nr:membrane protein insertase YidC [Parcubacteria group bacterium]